ncbi:FAD-dependent oxidoreductase [Leadbettera azotonutricia]|uniref:Invasion protein IbeA n=1 Tax=Leadbettera azotonutricia (strain ATCC BAA-888 / DSM 13862 / ZAS-9) TaxID=545695 RepID=F5YG92_LEAAZ|nr:FAD-dependent oxidoreductase [Leadbettera azotonutricia]AEF81363.1 invasion protein IbeA [Leadbettera azotonutricia ZAS-9]
MIEYINEPSREIPILLDVDVLVVGGGPAGIASSVGAARTGAKTVVVEQYGCLGGLISIASMETPSWWRNEKTIMPGGVAEDLDQKMLAIGAAKRTMFRPGTGYAYDTEIFKYVADEYIQENGVIPILHCQGVMPLLEGNTIIGIITESKSGRTVIKAKRVIDCTGDADIAYRAGVECCVKDGPNGPSLPPDKFQQGTVIYSLTDVDVKAVEEEMDSDPAQRNPIMHRGNYHWWKAAIDAGEIFPESTNRRFIYNRFTDHELTALNHSFVWVDGTDVLSLTKAEIQSRKDIVNTIPIMRKYAKGLENAKLRHFAMSIGIRETRRIKGEYQITFKEIFDEAKFKDSIGVYPICLDGPEGVMPALTEAHFQVPYRLTVPLKIENLLVAGRCVSAERRSTSITRHMNFAMVTGQAAGVASSLSIKQDVYSRQVDIKALQQELRNQHVRIE